MISKFQNNTIKYDTVKFNFKWISFNIKGFEYMNFTT
jgi:hypothetical protein